MPTAAAGSEVVLTEGEAVVTVTAAAAVLRLLATLVAETVTFADDAARGAVSRPLVEMLPPLVDHVTADSLVPLTVAVNCSDVPGATVALAGEIAVMTWLDGAVANPAVGAPAQPVNSARQNNKDEESRKGTAADKILRGDFRGPANWGNISHL